jgi:signal transduction histidine kinase
MTDNGIASIVRALAGGVDPGRVLREVAQVALRHTATSHVLLAAMLEGELTPIVAIGSLHSVIFEAAQEAFGQGRPARRSDPTVHLAAVAVPVRHRGLVVAALAVAGTPEHGRPPLAPESLNALADCAALALAERPVAGALSGGPDEDSLGLVEALATIAAATTTDEVVAAALDVAAARFGARAGFVCLPAGPDGVEVVGWRGIDRDRLGPASRHPRFTALIAGSDVAVVPPTDPVVAQLTAGAEFAVSLPVAAGEPGALVLLMTEAPDAAGCRALGALGAQVAAGLRTARTGAAVEAAGAQLTTLLHALPDPALAVDGGGRFSVLNAAAAELFALSDSFEIGRPARGRLGHPGIEGLLLSAGTEGFVEGSEVVLGRPTPRRFAASTRSLAAGGRVLFLRSAGAAAPAARETDALAAALGRALRDPVATITTLASAGAAGAGLATGGDWDVARKGILAEAARLEAVADQLALLSPDGHGPAAVTVRAEHCDVVAVATLVVAGHRATAPGRDLTIAGPPRLPVVADRRLLERVLDPLLDNALRYSDGPVTVEIADRGETFEVAVVDAGPGIFSGDIPGLFERYHPLDGSPVRQGAGIGLYTCRRLVELMGGRIWCDSRLGVGSRFALRLPHVPAAR